VVKLFKRSSHKAGLKPGSVVYVGEQREQPVTISLLDYDDRDHTERTLTDIAEAAEYRKSKTITWISVDGVHDTDLISRFETAFDIHPLVLEDIVNTGQRPKLEDFGDYLFLVAKGLRYDRQSGVLVTEQFSFVVGPGWLISFHEGSDTILEQVRARLIKTVPRVRFLNIDYLAYALVDAIVDNYYAVFEELGDEIEVLEDDLVDRPAPEELQKIQQLKRNLIAIRKTIWPMRELAGGFDRSENTLINKSTVPYLRDLYDHVIQAIDTVETYRDMVSGLLDIYLSSVSNRMNEVMKVLTIIATIFIPLGFLAGVYGMNFDTSASPYNLPELGFAYGYPLFWLLVLLIGGGLFWFFRRRDWI